MDLLTVMDSIPSDRDFLVFKDKAYTFGEVKRIAAKFIGDHSYLEGKCCAVYSSDRESLALFLPAINKLCNTTFLMPSEIEVESSKYYETANISYVVKLQNKQVVSIEKVGKDVSLQLQTAQQRLFLLATSGTTGSPKLAQYSLESLTATSKRDIDSGKNYVWGLCYDINRFAGLQVYLQSIMSGSSLVIGSYDTHLDSLVNLFSKNFVNCLSATPSFWRKLLMTKAHKEIPLKRITLGGEISHNNILESLSKAYPLATVIHIYASTEAGVGFAVKDGLEGFPARFLNKGSIPSCELLIKDDTLWMKSKNGCTRLIKGQLEFDGNGYIDTGDLVKLVGERVLFLGRKNGSINVGGNKVMPETVEAVLESHPQVKLARVYAKKSPILGSLVLADIVLNKEQRPINIVKKEVIEYCRKHLEAYEVPVIVKHVDKIETNTTGKKIRSK